MARDSDLGGPARVAASRARSRCLLAALAPMPGCWCRCVVADSAAVPGNCGTGEACAPGRCYPRARQLLATVAGITRVRGGLFLEGAFGA